MRTVRLVSLCAGGFGCFLGLPKATPAISCAQAPPFLRRTHAAMTVGTRIKSRCHDWKYHSLWGFQKRIKHFFLHGRQQRTEPI